MKTSKLKEILENGDLELDEKIAQIMALNGQDVNTAKGASSTRIQELESENEALKASKTELSAKVDTYKDYEELKKFKADFIANQEKTQKTDFLKALGCKHPDLFVNQIDWSKASYDTEKKTYTGLDEAVKGLKTTYKDMFEDNTQQPIINQFNPNLGQPTGNPQNKFADDPVMREYLQKHPDAKIY